MKKLVGKIKAKSKEIATSVAAVCTAAMLTVGAFAAESEAVAAMQEGLATVKSDTMSIVLIALPAGLGIFGLFFAIRKGISMLRGVAGK